MANGMGCWGAAEQGVARGRKNNAASRLGGYRMNRSRVWCALSLSLACRSPVDGSICAASCWCRCRCPSSDARLGRSCARERPPLFFISIFNAHLPDLRTHLTSPLWIPSLSSVLVRFFKYFFCCCVCFALSYTGMKMGSENLLIDQGSFRKRYTISIF